MNYKKYLKESTVAGAYAETGPKAMAGDDDFPTGNIIMGDKYKKTGYYNKLTNFNVNWVPDLNNWGWLDFDSTVPQGSIDAYSETLLDHPLSGRLFKKMKKTGDVPDVPTRARTLGGDIGPFTDAWGNPADDDEYEKTGDLEDQNQDGTEGDAEDDWQSKYNKNREERKKEGRPYRPRAYRDVVKKINGLI